jgi:hypothetical protein
MAKRWFLILGILALLGWSSQALAQDDALTETFTSEDGRLTIHYPESWHLYTSNEFDGSLVFIFSADRFSMTMRLVNTANRFYYSPFAGPQADDPTPYGILEYYIEDTSGFAWDEIEIQNFTSNDRPAARYADLSPDKASGERLALAIGFGNGNNVIVDAFSREPVIGDNEATILAIAENLVFEDSMQAEVDFSPAAPGTGNIVWQHETALDGSSTSFGAIRNLKVDAHDQLYLATDQAAHAVLTMDVDGNVIAGFRNPDFPLGADDLAVVENDFWVLDRYDNEVHRLNDLGNIIQTEALYGGFWYRPMQLEVGEDGNFYVVTGTVGGDRQGIVQIFSPQWEFIREFNIQEPGVFESETLDADFFLSISPDGLLYIANPYMGIVRVYDSEGNLLDRQFGGLSEVKTAFAAPDGFIYIVSYSGGTLFQYDAEGNLTKQYEGIIPNYDTGSARAIEFRLPTRFAMLSNGDLIVASTNSLTQITRLNVQ